MVSLFLLGMPYISTHFENGSIATIRNLLPLEETRVPFSISYVIFLWPLV